MDFDFSVTEGLSVVTGIIIEFWRRKWKFDRTNSMGVEQFLTYSEKLITNIIDYLLLFCALVFVATGLISVIVN